MLQYLLLGLFSLIIGFTVFYFSIEKIESSFKTFPKYKNIKNWIKYFFIIFLIISIILDLVLYYIIGLYFPYSTILYKIILLGFIGINKILALLFTYDLIFSELYLTDLLFLYIVGIIFLLGLFFIYPGLLGNLGINLFYFLIAGIILIIFLILSTIITSLFKNGITIIIKEIKQYGFLNYILQFTGGGDFIIIPFFSIFGIFILNIYHNLHFISFLKFYLAFLVISGISTIIYFFIHKHSIFNDKEGAVPLFPGMIIGIYITLLLFIGNISYFHLY